MPTYSKILRILFTDSNLWFNRKNLVHRFQICDSNLTGTNLKHVSFIYGLKNSRKYYGMWETTIVFVVVHYLQCACIIITVAVDEALTLSQELCYYYRYYLINYLKNFTRQISFSTFYKLKKKMGLGSNWVQKDHLLSPFHYWDTSTKQNVNITLVMLFPLLCYPKQKCIKLALFVLLIERGSAANKSDGTYSNECRAVFMDTHPFPSPLIPLTWGFFQKVRKHHACACCVGDIFLKIM